LFLSIIGTPCLLKLEDSLVFVALRFGSLYNHPAQCVDLSRVVVGHRHSPFLFRSAQGHASVYISLDDSSTCPNTHTASCRHCSRARVDDRITFLGLRTTQEALYFGGQGRLRFQHLPQLVRKGRLVEWIVWFNDRSCTASSAAGLPLTLAMTVFHNVLIPPGSFSPTFSAAFSPALAR
jgi:hypothetical protein